MREGLQPILPAISDLINRLIDGKRELGSFGKALDFVIRESVVGDLDNLPKAIDKVTDTIGKLQKQREDLTKPGIANAINNFISNDVETTDAQIALLEKRRDELRSMLKRERERQDAEARPPATAAGVDFSAFGKPAKAGGSGGAVRDFSSQRFQLAKAEAEAELKILQDTLKRYETEWDYALEQNLVSFRAAAQARVNIQQAEIDAQIRARQAELAEAQKVANDPKANEGGKLDAMARIKTLTADIIVLRQQRGDVEVAEGRKAAEQEEALAAGCAR